MVGNMSGWRESVFEGELFIMNEIGTFGLDLEHDKRRDFGMSGVDRLGAV